MESPVSPSISFSSLMSPEGSERNQPVSSTPVNYADPLVPELNGNPLFESGDGDMELIVNGTRFETHRYLIKRFKKWGDTNPKLQSGSTMTITGTASSEDFGRMLRVLYSTLEGPFEFDTLTLVSALHIATEYEYPALRDYAVRHLEQADLTAIKRIELARKFGLTSWEKPAYTELCSRDGAITEEEAGILGMAAFVRVARIREKEQRRRTRADVEQELKLVEVENPRVESVKKDTTILRIGGDESRKESPLHRDDQFGRRDSERNLMDLGKGEGPEPEEAQIQAEVRKNELKPSFMDISITGTYQEDTYESVNWQVGLPTPECDCQYGGEFSAGATHQPCILPPCAVAAFKALQIKQLAHTKSIADLCGFVDGLQAMSKSEPISGQNVHSRIPGRSFIHKEVQVMLSELS
ncbi:unnamed protein product [Rhizoctonia solani]|uniref:BTB domain-containing protein n=1 Tax=Rhizoctonia solani TaxID=456999 RepID=A0A8H3DFS7_9AGAM|nr:unnamed protein product [Rhizoctonia solani]